MTTAELRNLLRESPLVASVQSSENSATEHPETLARLAQASAVAGVRLIRCQGAENIAAIREATRLPTIGLIKRQYRESSVYITATEVEVDEVLATGTEIVALDGTTRARPREAELANLIARIHQRKALAMADCDCIESAAYALSCGADILGTTLSGYTEKSPMTKGPDVNLLREVVRLSPISLAEGRYTEPWQAEAALRIGAAGVVVGGALNDPLKQTRAFCDRMRIPKERVGAVDLGGTWLRFGVFDSEGKLLDVNRVPTPPSKRLRMDWIRGQIGDSNVEKLGVGTAGTVDPLSGVVIASKPSLPDHVGTEFSESTLGIPTVAYNDGHATAWGHACLPQFAGKRSVSVSIGTGVGCGVVSNHQLWMGPRGQHPRLNDAPLGTEHSLEQLLGGLYLGKDPSQEQRLMAKAALEASLQLVVGFYFPDVVVLSGGIGLAPWLELPARSMPSVPEQERLSWVCAEVIRSPFGEDAGLHGAAALALFPPSFAGTEN